ncbi:hypothetical protein JHS3_20470 [Jeongeupia sp. HS-3]|uniref:SPOR domain-containing protein n=1 Tax=Jeongeupia sp. HS-3 TaxID=1009682 RepID=UPI0018A428BF|nr:SPOR domain-containing protein [Jeongeupia sp. HS-3]BCL76311.1 hypothetical protein JHS3_20470 [Jeongeupia sp. HS-3]
MKWFLATLLALNLLFFGYTRLMPERGSGEARLPEIAASQVQTINLAGVANTPTPTPIPLAASGPEATPAPQPSPTPRPTPTPTPKPQAQAETAGVCLRWAGLSGADIDSARARLKLLGLSAQEHSSGENSRVWVYIPPLADLDTAKKKAEQLAELGVDDYLVVNDGKRWQNAISLGVFSTKEAGERRLAQLQAKGVRSAVVRERDDGLKPTSFTIARTTPEQLQKLQKASAQLRGAQLQEIACK